MARAVLFWPRPRFPAGFGSFFIPRIRSPRQRLSLERSSSIDTNPIGSACAPAPKTLSPGTANERTAERCARMTRTLSILGGGSWGTALAIALSPRFESLRLWVFERDLAECMLASRENDVYLPGLRLPPNVQIVSDLATVIDGARIVLCVVPSRYSRSLYRSVLPHLDASMVFVIATKGIENVTLLRMSQVLTDVVGPKFEPQIAVLSGPTFAREVARGEPAAVVIA